MKEWLEDLWIKIWFKFFPKKRFEGKYVYFIPEGVKYVTVLGTGGGGGGGINIVTQPKPPCQKHEPFEGACDFMMCKHCGKSMS